LNRTALAAAGLAAVTALTGCSAAAQQPTQPAATAPSATAPPGGAAIPAANAPPPMVVQVAQWWAGSGQGDVTTLQNDLVTISAHQRDPAMVRGDGQQLALDGAAAAALTPPDGSLAAVPWPGVMASCAVAGSQLAAGQDAAAQQAACADGLGKIAAAVREQP